MSIRRDYTNGSGYVCPTENAAIGHLDKPKERIQRPARHSGVLHEQEINRMSKPTPMQALAQIAEQEAEELKKARALWSALAGIAAVMDYSITAIELKPKGGTSRYYKDATTKTLEKRCGK